MGAWWKGRPSGQKQRQGTEELEEEAVKVTCPGDIPSNVAIYLAIASMTGSTTIAPAMISIPRNGF